MIPPSHLFVRIYDYSHNDRILLRIVSCIIAKFAFKIKYFYEIYPKLSEISEIVIENVAVSVETLSILPTPMNSFPFR